MVSVVLMYVASLKKLLNVHLWWQLQEHSGQCPNSNCLSSQKHLIMPFSCLFFLHCWGIIYYFINGMGALKIALSLLSNGGALPIWNCYLISFSLCCLICWFISDNLKVHDGGWFTWKNYVLIGFVFPPLRYGHFTLVCNLINLMTNYFFVKSLIKSMVLFGVFHCSKEISDAYTSLFTVLKAQRGKKFCHDIPSFNHHCCHWCSWVWTRGQFKD